MISDFSLRTIIKSFKLGALPPELCDIDIETLVRLSVRDELSRLPIKAFKDLKDYMKAVKTTKANNADGSNSLAVFLTVRDGKVRRVRGNKGTAMPALCTLSEKILVKGRRLISDGLRGEQLVTALGIFAALHCRLDGGWEKPRFLFMAPGSVYPLEAPILDRVSHALKHEFDRYGYFSYSATSFLSSTQGWVISSDFSAYDQTIPGEAISLIVEEIIAVLNLPEWLGFLLGDILRYVPVLSNHKDQPMVIRKDGMNPSGFGIFVAINHLFAHAIMTIAPRLACLLGIRRGLNTFPVMGQWSGWAFLRKAFPLPLPKPTIRLGPVLKFGDDVLSRWLANPVIIRTVVHLTEEILSGLGIGWKTDSISRTYCVYLRNHLFCVEGIWHVMDVFSSRVRNLVFPESNEPALWFAAKEVEKVYYEEDGERHWYLKYVYPAHNYESAVKTAIILRAQFSKLEVTVRVMLLMARIATGQLREGWLKAYEVAFNLLFKLKQRSRSQLMLELDDASLGREAERLHMYDVLSRASDWMQ